jgi:hypothetical protein
MDHACPPPGGLGAPVERVPSARSSQELLDEDRGE